MSCCKLYLVPEDVINTWRAEQRASEVDKPVSTLVNRMDDKMNDILQSDLSEHDKGKLYSQHLSKYLTLRDQKQTPPPHLLSAPALPSDADKFDPTPLLSSIPQRYRTKAAGLLEYLKEDAEVDWDERGHVYLGQRKLDGSHIVDLLHDAMRHRKKHGKPQGWEELSSYLRSRNVPREIVPNEEWQKESQKHPPSAESFATPLASSTHKRLRRKVMESVTKSRHKQMTKKLWDDATKLDWEKVPDKKKKK